MFIGNKNGKTYRDSIGSMITEFYNNNSNYSKSIKNLRDYSLKFTTSVLEVSEERLADNISQSSIGDKIREITAELKQFSDLY